MNFRASQIYVSAGTRRMLKLVARSEGPKKTVDEVGDRLLSEALTTRYPALALFQKQMEELESQTLESISKPL